MSVRTQLVVAVLVSLIVAGAVGAWVVDRAYRDSIELVAKRELEASRQAFTGLVSAETESLSVATSVIAKDPRIPGLLFAQDRTGLDAASRNLFDTLITDHGVTHWYYEQTPVRGGQVILRVHRPELFGDKLERLTYQQAVMTGTGSGLELGRTAFALRHVRAVRQGDRVVGYVELGKEISNFLDDLRSSDGNEYALVVAKDRLGTRAEKDWEQIRAVYPRAGEWSADPENLLVDSTASDAEVWSGDIDDLPETGTVLRTEWHDDVAHAELAFPIEDAGGTRIGAVISHVDVTEFYTRARRSQLQILLGMGAIMLILGISLTWYLDRLLTRGPLPDTVE